MYDLTQIFQIFNGFHNTNPRKFFNDNYTHGHSFRLEKQQVKESLGLNFFPLRCINAWNQLPKKLYVKLDKVPSGAHIPPTSATATF